MRGHRMDNVGVTGAIDRRTLLAMSAGAGLSGILASGRAPAHAQGTTLKILRLADPVTARDDVLDRQMADASRAVGATVTLVRVDPSDMAKRVTAAIAARAGPDIVELRQNDPHVHEAALADVSDVVEEIARAQGGFHPACEVLCRVRDTWRSMPHAITPNLVVYRPSLHEEEPDAFEFPRSWQEWHEVGRTLKGRGAPIGQTVGRALVDGPAFWYPYLWSWGAREVEPDGKTVVLDLSATVESVTFATTFWKDSCNEQGLAWADGVNARAFLGGTIASTLGTGTIYLTARADPATFRTANGAPLHTDIRYAPLPGNSGIGQFAYHRASHHGVMRYSANLALAKNVLRWLHARDAFQPWFVAGRGSAIGSTRTWERHPLWTQDPVMLPFRDAARSFRLIGFSGRPSAKAARAVSSHVLVDMYAKAIRGTPPDEAVKWAAGELQAIYA